MNNTLRNNRDLLRKPSMFKKKKSLYEAETVATHKTASQFTTENKPTHTHVPSTKVRNNTRIPMALFILLATVIFGVIYLQTSEEKTDTAENVSPNTTKQQATFDFYLQDADYWFGKGNFHNAIYQYRNALTIFPEDFDANYGLALSYINLSTKTGNQAEATLRQISKMDALFPNRKEVLLLKEMTAAFPQKNTTHYETTY